MASPDTEIPLRGGRVTPGIVRVGDTVRRPPAPNAAFVRQLLGHLAAHGFDAAPLALGADAQGREIFSFIPGDVPADLAFHPDATLAEAARLIRRFHDLTAGFVTPSAAVDTVCHNDLSPCNVVFDAGRPVALIDFDAAAPGLRVDDLGYAAWLWLDIGSSEVSAAEQRRRLALFLDAYGAGDRPAILAAMLRHQARLRDEARGNGDVAMAGWAADCLHWTLRYQPPLLGL